MKAMTFTKYGSPDVLTPAELDVPQPAKGEVLIKVEATAVNAADWHLLRADPFLIRLFFGVFKPKYKVLGADVAGRIAAVGEGVTRFEVGDAVFGDISADGFGGFAEFATAKAATLVKKPENLSFDQAAAVPMAATAALQALRKFGKLKAGETVLVNGASGGVGAFSVQIAKALGATVTAVCSPRNLERVRELGADYVIDYTQDDFTQGEARYDLIHVANGDRSIFDYRRALAPNGRCVISGGAGSQTFQAMLLGPLVSLFGSRKVSSMLALPNAEDLEQIKRWIEAGAIRPVIDRRYGFGEVAEAIRYVEDGHAQGKVVVMQGA